MFSKLRFLVLKDLSPSQFLGNSNWRRYHWILKRYVATWKSEEWEQNFVGLFYYFNFERKCDVLKSKSLWILLNKNINFNKTKRNWKSKSRTRFYLDEPCVSAHIRIANQKKKKNVMSKSLWKKKRSVNVPSVCPKGIFFNICVLSQCIAYWIHFQNTNTVTYQKTLLHTLLLFVFIIAESLQCILKSLLNWK